MGIVNEALIHGNLVNQMNYPTLLLMSKRLKPFGVILMELSYVY